MSFHLLDFTYGLSGQCADYVYYRAKQFGGGGRGGGSSGGGAGSGSGIV